MIFLKCKFSVTLMRFFIEKKRKNKAVDEDILQNWAQFTSLLLVKQLLNMISGLSSATCFTNHLNLSSSAAH